VVLNALLIDTSCERGFVALACGSDLPIAVELHGRTGAQQLVPLLEAQLIEKGMNLKSVDVIGVTIGPGSYTGIRLGVVAAESLAFALGVPLAGVSGLNVYAPPPPFDGAFTAILDARMGGVYLACHQIYDSQLHAGIAEVCAIEQLAERIDGNVVTIATPQRQHLQQRCLDLGIGEQWTWHDCAPSPTLLLDATVKAYRQGNLSSHVAESILYLRRTQAEIARDAADNHTNTLG
jgi:tRNA threonylcarbamoyladenosine biosynthesis protein TsaB